MRIFECLDGLEARAVRLRQRGAGRFADAVDGDDRRAIEAGREIRRSGGRQVVGDELESLPQGPSEKLVHGGPNPANT